MALLFRQLFDRETCTYTYVLASKGKALLIDPVLELVERDAKLLKELELDLVAIANTHVHADHVTGSGELKKIFSNAKSYIAKVSGAVADVKFSEGDDIPFGELSVKCVSTPGHTAGCHTFVLPADEAQNRPTFAFTGDALLVRGCGRTDFQQGSSETLFHSVTEKIFKLPPNTKVYPAHDYRGFTSSTVAEELKHNPRLHEGQTLEKFTDIMKNLNLAYPQRIDVSLPLNMRCGLHDVVDENKDAAEGGAKAE